MAYCEKFNSLDGNPEAQIQLAEEMWRKYPDSWDLASDIVSAIRDDRDHINERLPRLREVCRTIIDKCPISFIREKAAITICTLCEESEFDSWAGYLPSGGLYVHSIDDVLEERYWMNGERDKAKAMWGLNNLYRIAEFLGRDSRHGGSPERSLPLQKRRLDLIDFISCGETINAWLPNRAFSTLRLSAAFFGMGQNEEGYQKLEKALELYEQWFAIPEGTELNLGDEVFFGKLRIKPNEEQSIFFPDGTKHIYCTWIFYIDQELPYSILTRPHGWEWFDSVRNEDRFKQVVERAKILMEANTK